ncbi:hypothetical protein IGI04_042639 [Brassica rapa subsp. trilocularis]|uniref:Uncharacterized protein n=1 Tax=Brassica rapa subsp. trilocularis TaxID=1813537 RepID=A0ABQ7KLS3_BRACM|nr:hypothetical protein IGI04_042639 [Brassica rapa subsp. trilocularis]
MDQLANGDDEDLDKPTVGDVLALPKGPMTRSRSRKLTQVIGGLVPMGKESEEEAELVRKNKMLRDQMTEQMNQTMISTMADMLKASMKELREEMRQELRQATGQGHSNESRRNRPTPVRQENAGSQETDNYYSRNITEHNPTERSCEGVREKMEVWCKDRAFSTALYGLG